MQTYTHTYTHTYIDNTHTSKIMPSLLSFFFRASVGQIQLQGKTRELLNLKSGPTQTEVRRSLGLPPGAASAAFVLAACFVSFGCNRHRGRCRQCVPGAVSWPLIECSHTGDLLDAKHPVAGPPLYLYPCTSASWHRCNLHGHGHLLAPRPN